jgi:hypothetical protein
MCTQNIDDAVAAARRLLAHAADTGVEIDQPVIKGIIDFDAGPPANHDPSRELEFWRCYRLLANKLSPVSSTSLDQSAIDSAKRQRRKSTVHLTIVLGITIFLSSYFFIGKYVSNSLSQEIADLCKVSLSG